MQSFIEGLRHGNDKLKLVRLKDDDFQDKMKELDEYFISLHKEIYRVRTVGYEHTDIISKSERFFKTVSYTHLDVYKRQVSQSTRSDRRSTTKTRL